MMLQVVVGPPQISASQWAKPKTKSCVTFSKDFIIWRYEKY